MADAKKITTVGGGALFSTPERPAVEVDETNTVTKFFPKGPVKLTLQDYTSRSYGPGVQEIPAQFADDPWLKANGMIDVPNSGPLPPMMMTAQPGSQAHARLVGNTTGLYDAALVPQTQYGDADFNAAQEHAQMAAEAVRQAEENLAAAQRVHASAVDGVNTIAARIEEQRSAPRQLSEETSETAQQRAAREKREAKAAADEKIIAGLSAKEKEDFDKLDDAGKEKFLNSKRKAN